MNNDTVLNISYMPTLRRIAAQSLYVEALGRVKLTRKPFVAGKIECVEKRALAETKHEKSEDDRLWALPGKAAQAEDQAWQALEHLFGQIPDDLVRDAYHIINRLASDMLRKSAMFEKVRRYNAERYEQSKHA